MSQDNQTTKQNSQTKKGKKLTEGQAIALQQLYEFLNSNNQTFCLTGFAGTGKTFLTQLILEHCLEKKLKFTLCAPTNKAAKVLSQTTGEDAVTIARLLGIRPKIDKDTGKEIFAPDPKVMPADLDKFDLVILDEASMISLELLEILSQEFTLFGPKFIFLGDPAQLPPVGEQKSLVFEQVEQQSHLTEVVRYSGAMLHWATALRTQSKVAPPSNFTDEETLLIHDDRVFAELLVAEFSSDGFKKESDYCRVLAWTNASVSRWNKKIRGAIFGKNAPRFVAGERLIATGACTVRKANAQGQIEEMLILPSSGEVEVITARRDRATVEFGVFQADLFNYWLITAQDEEGVVRELRVLDTDEEARVSQLLKSYATRRDWENYWGLKRAFHPLQYAYALTVHRSQGSTFQKVFLDFRNLLTNRKSHERQKLLYTAATRASEQMIVLE